MATTPITVATVAHDLEEESSPSGDGNEDLHYSRLLAAHCETRTHHHVFTQPQQPSVRGDATLY